MEIPLPKIIVPTKIVPTGQLKLVGSPFLVLVACFAERLVTEKNVVTLAALSVVMLTIHLFWPTLRATLQECSPIWRMFAIIGLLIVLCGCVCAISATYR